MTDEQSESALMNAKGGRSAKCIGCGEWLNQRECAACSLESPLDYLVSSLHLMEVYSHKIALMAELLPTLNDAEVRQGSDGIKRGLDDLGMLTERCRNQLDAEAERIAGELGVETSMEEGGGKNTEGNQGNQGNIMDQLKTQTAEKKPTALPEWKYSPVPTTTTREQLKCDLGRTTITVYPKSESAVACAVLDVHLFDFSAAPDTCPFRDVALGMLVAEIERVLPILKRMVSKLQD